MKYTNLPYDDSQAYGLQKYLVDSADDIKDLPTNCAVGSKAIVANGGVTYLLNNKHEWKAQNIPSGSGSNDSNSNNENANPGYNISIRKTYYAEEQTVTLDEYGRASLEVGDRHMSDFNNYATGIVNINGVEFTGSMSYYFGWYLGSFSGPDSVIIDGVEAIPGTAGDANNSEHIFDAFTINEGESLAGKTCTVSVYFVDEEVTVTEDFKKAARESTKVYRKTLTMVISDTLTYVANTSVNLPYIFVDTLGNTVDLGDDFDEMRFLSVFVPPGADGKWQFNGFNVNSGVPEVRFWATDSGTINAYQQFATIELIKYFEPFEEPSNNDD